MPRLLCPLITVAFGITFIAPALCAEKNASELELKTERAIVFKDGYALIIKRGVATTDKGGEVYTDDVPDAAVLGSFWAVPDGGRLISMLAGSKSTKDSDDKPMPCTQAQANPAAEGVVDLPNELTASGAQDLFVYNLPKLTLGKGDRMAVPILSTEVPYRDLYTWDVHLTKHDNDAAPSGSDAKSPLTLAKNEVWHQIVLTNSTKFPWTTGAAMIMQGNQPLAQELLTYTPPKDEVRVPVTISVDTRGSLSEKEVGRDLKSLPWDGYNYARIDKEMKLDMCNNKALDIEAEVTLRVGGKVDKASLDGDVTIGAFDTADWVQYNGHPAVNNSSTVTWKTKLKPGEKFEPSVSYHYFTRH